MTLKDADKYDGVVSQVSGMDGVGNVNSLKKLLGPLFELLDKMKWASLGVAALLIVAAILQVSNTIRMTAYARRREIGIMRLVGASSWHIQLPVRPRVVDRGAALGRSGGRGARRVHVLRGLRLSARHPRPDHDLGRMAGGHVVMGMTDRARPGCWRWFRRSS